MNGNNQYLIPANTKKGGLIFNIFQPIDLWIFGIGVGYNNTYIINNTSYIALHKFCRSCVYLMRAGPSMNHHYCFIPAANILIKKSVSSFFYINNNLYTLNTSSHSIFCCYSYDCSFNTFSISYSSF